MAFFQRPTQYPCQLILDPQNDYETLRRRVEQTTLKSQTVNRNRSGVTNVSVCVCVKCKMNRVGKLFHSQQRGVLALTSIKVEKAI